MASAPEPRTPVPQASGPRRRGRKPPSDELIERRRTEIIEAAFQVFSTRGYSSAGIADIAERLGMGHGTFYRYFKNKRDILDAVVDYGVERIVSELELETETPATTLPEFADQLRHIGERLFRLLDAEPGLGQIVLLEATSIDEEMTARVLGLMDTFAALGASFFSGGISASFIRSDLDPANLGRAIAGLVLPGLFMAVRGEAGPEARSQYIETIVALVCDGVRAR
ncbi:MAG: TetR/AcrR family transcriptional regulator [Solirubrobacteraceae bacterium]